MPFPSAPTRVPTHQAVRGSQLLKRIDQTLHSNTDFFALAVLLVQWMICIGIVAPWRVQPGGTHEPLHEMSGHLILYIHSALLAVSTLMVLWQPGRLRNRYVLSLGLLLMAGLLYHRTPTTLLVVLQPFCLLVFLARYRDGRVLLWAMLTSVSVAVIGAGYLRCCGVTGCLGPALQYAGFICLESALLLWAIREARWLLQELKQRGAEFEACYSDFRQRAFERTQQLTRELSERKKQEHELGLARDEALAAARLKAEFLANMSHEIRTPMNGIIGMTGLLLDSDLAHEQQEFVRIIRSCGESLLTLVNDILDFSKIEAGKLTFEVLDFELHATVDSVVDLLAEQAESKRIELITVVHDGVPSRLRGDPGRLRQVLVNLVSNAVKFTEKGEVLVEVRTQAESAGQVVLQFRVRDTGIGISAQGCKTLFQAFTQADGSFTRKYGGTGLGLAISKKLVEMMQGQICVESELGKGSTFIFTALFERQAAADAVSVGNRSAPRGARVLIVDDNATSRAVLKGQLAMWGLQGEEAPSASEALLVLREAVALGHPFDAAVIDAQMPDVDGPQLVHAIRQEDRLTRLPLILLTSLAGAECKGAQARECGALCLSKPVKQSRLFDALAVLLTSDAAAGRSVDRSSMERGTLDPATAPTSPSPVQASRAHILVAEDNQVNQKVILRLLAKLGYRADAVGNGIEALAALRQIPYDVVLMDCQMPDLDGYSATGELRRREQAEGTERRTHVIALTAHTMQGDRERCLAAGMDDYLSKPVRIEELDWKLKQWLELRQISLHSTGKLPPVDAPVDLRTLKRSADDDMDLMRDLVSLYMRQGDIQIADLRSALDAERLSDVERLAHSLAGASLTFGMSGIVGPLRQLESMARSKQLSEPRRYWDQVKSEFERIGSFLADAGLLAA